MKKVIVTLLIICLLCTRVNAAEYSSASINTFSYKISENSPKAPNYEFGYGNQECKDILGPNLTKVVKVGITAIQIIGAIVAIVNGMISLIPAVMANYTDGLKKAEKKLVYMAIVLLCIFLLPYFIRWIGHIFDFDISCIV